MRILRGEGDVRRVLLWGYPGFFVVLLAAAIATNLVQFLNSPPSLPTLFKSFLPSALVAFILLAGLLALRSQGRVFPSLTLPQGSPRLVLFTFLVVLALVSVLGIAAAVSVANWGLSLAAPILLAFVLLVVVFWLSLYRVVDALALYFAIWPVLTVIRTTVLLAQEPGVHQSVLIAPMRIEGEGLASTMTVVADSAWGQIALLSPEVLFIFAIFAGWVFSRRPNAPGGFARTPIDRVVVVLLGAGLISALLSSAPVFSVVWFIGALVTPILLFYLVASTVRSERDLTRVLWGMLAGLAFISTYHVFSVFQAHVGTSLGFDSTSIGSFGRFSPVLGNSNVAGAIVVYLLPVTFAIVARARVGGLAKVTVLLVILLAVVSILSSASRGPLLALLVMLAALFWLVPRSRFPIVLGVVLLALASLLFQENMAAAVLELRPSFSGELMDELGIASRLFIWQRSLELLAAPLIFGIGPGLFPELAIRFPGTSLLMDHAHQGFLNLGVEMGLIGLAAFVAIVLLIAWHGYRLIKSLEDSSYKRTLQILTIALLGFLVVVVTTGVRFNNGSWGIAGGLIPWAMAGLLMGARGSGRAYSSGEITEDTDKSLSKNDA